MVVMILKLPRRVFAMFTNVVLLRDYNHLLFKAIFLEKREVHLLHRLLVNFKENSSSNSFVLFHFLSLMMTPSKLFSPSIVLSKLTLWDSLGGFTQCDGICTTICSLPRFQKKLIDIWNHLLGNNPISYLSD